MINVSRNSNAIPDVRKNGPSKKVSSISFNRLEAQNYDNEASDDKEDLAKIILKKQRSSALEPLKLQTLNLVTTKNDQLNLSQRYKGNGQIIADILNASKNESYLTKNKKID